MKQTIQVYVATHKEIPYALPSYCEKMQVNAARNGHWDGYLHDDDGENISVKNAQYCELTVLYSLWKNCDAEIRGLFHYRRLLGERSKLSLAGERAKVTPAGRFAAEAITRETVLRELEEADVILPLPNCPYPTDALEDLRRFCYPGDIRIMCDVIREFYPDYQDALRETFRSSHLAYCNMFIAGRAFVDGYCAWLFDVLGRVEARVCLGGYDRGHQRIFGYLSEVLLNVYIRRHGLRCRYHYMVQLYEGDRYYVTAARRAVNSVLALGGVFPYIRNRQLWAARYEKLLALRAQGGQENEQVFPADPQALAALMRSVGAKRTEVREAEGLTCVFAQFAYAVDNIAIATFLADGPVPDDLAARITAQAPALRALMDDSEADTLMLRAGVRGGASEETARSLAAADIRCLTLK